MNEKLKGTIRALQEIKDTGETIVFNGDISAVTAALDAIGYKYTETAKNSSNTWIALR
ncbi:hypothetical protein [Bacillus mycoides]|uniref:hypothetical protein n=1 Tax=Bacillus mycoides TaxID=1405 RepID=UPI003A80013F